MPITWGIGRCGGAQDAPTPLSPPPPANITPPPNHRPQWRAPFVPTFDRETASKKKQEKATGTTESTREQLFARIQYTMGREVCLTWAPTGTHAQCASEHAEGQIAFVLTSSASTSLNSLFVCSAIGRSGGAKGTGASVVNATGSVPHSGDVTKQLPWSVHPQSHLEKEEKKSGSNFNIPPGG